MEHISRITVEVHSTDADKISAVSFFMAPAIVLLIISKSAAGVNTGISLGWATQFSALFISKASNTHRKTKSQVVKIQFVASTSLALVIAKCDVKYKYVI